MSNHKWMTVLAVLALLLTNAAAALPAGAQAPQMVQQQVIHVSLTGTVQYNPSATLPGSEARQTPRALIDRNIPRGPVGAAATRQPLAPVSLPTLSGNAIAHSNSGLLTGAGLNAFDNGSVNGFSVEPPDQALCAGNNYVIEGNNLVIKVFTSNLGPVSGAMTLESFFGDPLAFGVGGGDFTVQGDVRCYFDESTDRWFVSQLNVNFTTNTSATEVMVSQTDNPTGLWNKYVVDNTGTGDPGCPCLGDQPLIGASRDAFLISTNEFSINGPEFNGAQLYALDKQAMAAGSASVTAVHMNLGLGMPAPDAGGIWYSVEPTTAPGSQSDNRMGGTAYMLSAMDFFNLNDNRIALWALTNLSSLRGAPNIGVNETTVGSESYGLPAPADQKVGPIPLGDVIYGAPEGPIDSGDDRMLQTVYADGTVYGALTTGASVRSGGSTESRAAIAWFGVRPNWSGSTLSGSMVRQGYVAAAHNNVIYPAIASDTRGKSVIAFTLVGPDYYPSSAYMEVTGAGGGGQIHIAMLGQSPLDGFSEYEGLGTPAFRPRFGDYGAAAFSGGSIYFASEMVQHANCSDAQFAVDGTCGGTRATYANWGTSLARVNP